MNSIDYIRDKGWYHDLKDGEGQVVGVAVFDKGFPPHDCEAGITCLFLSKFHVYDSYTSDNIVYRILLLRLSQDTSDNAYRLIRAWAQYRYDHWREDARGKVFLN
jgi:hypothetical protein